jgi:hypothetical protein
MRKVEDREIQELFNEALQHDKSLLISERCVIKKTGLFFKSKEETEYSIYHQTFLDSGISAHEARAQISASGSKAIAMAYLFGIINGSLARQRKQKLHNYL